ncbi:MAG: type II toxin-antitoxin system PemK/MazF family toxin [Symploca sp. SIO2E6]|nr:type II toxin-antitoxin system PemK/MazF family toxin [Symploca sp. SIO2E6]
MAGQKPRQGWIYQINPHRVSLCCRVGHVDIYDLPEPGEFLECNHNDCTLKINPSRILRGSHPHITWTSNQFQAHSGYIQTFTLIPLSAKETSKGLPTVYPINPTSRNSLAAQAYAYVHQIYTVDANCLKDGNHNWLKRIGQLDKSDKNAIEERLQYFLGIQDNPRDDWFNRNGSPELLRKIFYNLSEDDRTLVIEEFLDF